jgi:integrase
VANLRLDLVKARAALKARAAVYWQPIARGRAIGYRAGVGTWQARCYVNGKLSYKALGDEHDVSYGDALKAATKWWDEMAAGAPRRYDVLRAIEDYAATKTANATPREQARAWRDIRYVAKHLSGEFLAREVAELKTADMEKWRDALAVKPTSRRRIYNILAAALSNANRLHGVGDVRAWRNIAPVRAAKATRSRQFIPTPEEVARLIERCDADFRQLVRAAVLIGARYGELTGMRVEDFDSAKGTVSVTGKTGEREVLLSTAAVAFLTEQAKGKLPRALMFTSSGAPWGPSMQSRRMRVATGTKAFVFYSLRHYCLSRQLSAGIPAAVVAKNAGTSEAMLRQHYFKFIREDRSMFDKASIVA